MNKIKKHDSISVPKNMVSNAERIKYQNYKTNTPQKFQINRFSSQHEQFLESLSLHLGIKKEKLDFVYFSACKGAEPHIDLLDSSKFESTTFVIPIILPSGKTIITAEDENIEVELNSIYEFNHEKIHSMTLEDTNSGCVVIMIAIKK